MPDEFERGLILGVLIGEGHFGGDGRQPQVTLRMHTRHESLFRWLVARVPGSRLYGPYHHSGRSYFQWMVRGQALREQLMPVLESCLTPEVDAYAFERFEKMKSRYPRQLGVSRDGARSSINGMDK
ncbi:MAG: hypothetical protein OER86_08035 [Phycisphaerae bacterium]|nr:hypothetical protein [Phycisphaerae bacterium]